MKNSNKFNSWLAGLIEGDGTLVTPNARRTIDGKKNYPHIQIAFNVKDLELAKRIIMVVGCGSIFIDKNTVRLSWWKQEEIINVINRINGNMRTPKILRLHKMIEWYNEEGSTIEKKEVDLTPIGENSWLSGMAEADSNFNVILIKRGNSYRVQRHWRLEVSQKTVYGSHQGEWIAQVSVYIDSSVLSRHREANFTNDGSSPGKIYSSFTTIAHSEKSIKRIEEYLEKNPLYSSKYLDYMDWKSCGQIIEKSTENYKKIQQIKSGMNSKRANFNWKHLDKLTDK